MSIIRGLLFTYDIENTDDLAREKLISSKDISNEIELIELFDKLTKPEFLSYRPEERQWHIDTLRHYLNTDENFESVFYFLDTYFDDEITNNRQFMKVLLRCLEHYNLDDNASESK